MKTDTFSFHRLLCAKPLSWSQLPLLRRACLFILIANLLASSYIGYSPVMGNSFLESDEKPRTPSKGLVKSRNGETARRPIPKVPNDAIYTFGNGIQFRTNTLTPEQIKRYAKDEKNLHEPAVEAEFMRIIKRNCYSDAVPIFLDIGAAAGYYCILAKKVCPAMQILAVNPSSYFRTILAEHMYLNNLYDFTQYPVAVVKRADEGAKFDIEMKAYGDAVEPSSNSNRSLPPPPLLRRKSQRKGNTDTTGQSEKALFRKAPPGPKERITGWSLDSLLDLIYVGRDSLYKGKSKVACMMLDIQGKELEVLLDWTKHKDKVQHLLIGVHSNPIYNELMKMFNPRATTTTTPSNSSNSYSVQLARRPESIINEPDGILSVQLKGAAGKVKWW